MDVRMYREIKDDVHTVYMKSIFLVGVIRWTIEDTLFMVVFDLK